MIPTFFEETQFFTNNYLNGVDWYLSLFEDHVNSRKIFFEKSANYFSEPKAPLRIKSLLKDVKIIALTIDPVQRAYSWYQVSYFMNIFNPRKLKLTSKIFNNLAHEIPQ